MDCYTMQICGLTRTLKRCPLNEKVDIAAFILFGDAELTVKAAEELLKKSPDFDVIMTAEPRGIPLAYEMTARAGSGTMWQERPPSSICAIPLRLR